MKERERERKRTGKRGKETTNEEKELGKQKNRLILTRKRKRYEEKKRGKKENIKNNFLDHLIVEDH